MTVRALAGAALLAAGVALAAADPSSSLVGGVAQHTSSKGETLQSLGARYGIDVAALRADNGLEARTAIRIGQVLLIDNRHAVPDGVEEETIVVNVPQRMLFYRSGGRTLGFPVAVGSSGWRTPLRPFTVVAKETDPTWDVPESIAAEARAKGKPLPRAIPPGPSNPLGRHWLGLSVGVIGIHGTNAPGSIFRAGTHGCIRVHPDDIARLFDLVAVGTPGRFVYEPVLVAQEGNDVFLEVHADVYRRSAVSAMDRAIARAGELGLTDRIDWVRAAAVVAARHGVARLVSR
ncbi:MAG: L,D-transpeptidase family protein [Vicinamibacterales bacterium]